MGILTSIRSPEDPFIGSALRTLEATPNNLAQQLTSFVGRRRELAEVRTLLRNNRLVPLDYRISPEVRLTPTTGHTPGHVSVVIESEGQKAVITGDMSHHPCQMAHPEWATGFDSDAPAAAATRRRMFAEWADEPTLVIGTHYAAPTAGRIRRDGDVFKFEV